MVGYGAMIKRLKSLFKAETRSDGDNYWEHWQMLRGGGINPEIAESVSSVYACVSVISETIGSLPLHLYKNDDKRSKATNNTLYEVLHSISNEYQTAVEFREWMTACYLLRGNAYALVERGRDGQVTSLNPLHPDSVSIVKVGNSYQYQTVKNGKPIRLLPHEIFHLKHRAGNNPLLGVSPIQASSGAIDLALAEQEHGNATFTNGAKLQGILNFPGALKPDQLKRLREGWSNQHSGARNSGKTPILEEGITYQPISMTLQDSEWIASRQFSVEEVARIFRVPPTMIGDLRHGNYSNSVELARQFVTITLRRHLVAWEQAINKQLLTSAGRKAYFPEHSVEGLLRGDSNNRASFYKAGIEAGWMLVSEARALENLPAIDTGSLDERYKKVVAPKEGEEAGDEEA